MTAHIIPATGIEAYDLIYQEHLAKVLISDQEILRKWLISSTDVWIGYVDEKALAVWGLVPPTLLSDRAYLWLWTTQHLVEHQLMFIRHSQRAVAEMLKRYPLIVGHAVVGNDKAIRWLRWLGAEFSRPQGQTLQFEIRAKHG